MRHRPDRVKPWPLSSTAISELAGQLRRGELDTRTCVLYVSPLKALSNDVQRNLEQPLAAIQGLLEAELGALPAITSAVRTGDTPPAARTLMRKRPPHILVTTPESLYILLTSDSGRATLKTVKTVIVDEIHAVAGNKRGAHLALSLARLDRLTPAPPVRIGLSATQRPIERVAEFLTGHHAAADVGNPCEIIDEGHIRDREIAIEMPKSPLEAVVSAEVSTEIRARIIELILSHRTTLVFVNTRRMTERLARALADELGDDAVCAHHGSMSKERRLDAEQRLKKRRTQGLGRHRVARARHRYWRCRSGVSIGGHALTGDVVAAGRPLGPCSGRYRKREVVSTDPRRVDRVSGPARYDRPR